MTVARPAAAAAPIAPPAVPAGGPLRVVADRMGAVEWNAFAARQSGYTHFHRAEWLDVMRRVMGHETFALAALDERDQPHAVLPLVRVKSPLFGHYLMSMPFLNYGGPLGSPEGVRLLVGHATERARRDRVKLLELRSRVPLDVGLPVSHRKVTVVLDLPAAGPDTLFKSFTSKLRSQVRRPQKEGVSVTFGPDNVAGFYEVFSQHMRDLGTPVLSRRLFEVIAETFGDSAWFGVAWLGGRPVACGAGFQWDGEFEMTWASSLREHNRIAPNMLLYWAFMERAMAEGLTRFNFGRCTPDGGTHKFKLQWGGVDEALHWYDYAPGGGEVHTPSPDAGALSMAPRIWQRLPLGLTNALGPHVVKYIP